MFAKIKWAIITNWVTTALGSIGGVPQIIQGYTSIPKNWSLIIGGVGTLLLGLAAKDAGRTGSVDPTNPLADAIPSRRDSGKLEP
jgi:hypothetical protein